MISKDPYVPMSRELATVPSRRESSPTAIEPPLADVGVSDPEIVQTSAASHEGADSPAPAQRDATGLVAETGTPFGTVVDGEPATLTLPLALDRSLVANPDLVTLRGQINVNEAMVGVAKTYPWNPFVQAQFLPRGNPFVPTDPAVPASGSGAANYYIWVMQRFELAHQRKHRTDSAVAAMTQVQWNIFQGELLNVAQTTRLYFAALYQKEIRDLAQETAELNDRLVGVVERRFKANLARAADVTTARVSARQARRQAELAETTYKAALLALRQQMNLPLTAPVALTENLAAIHWLPVGSEGGEAEHGRLAAELVEGRPDVMAALAGVSVSEASFRLARAAIVPDVQAGPIYDAADNGTRFLGFRVQMDIPVWNNGTPLARQRREEMHQQQLTYSQLKVRAALEAQTAIDQYERMRALAARATSARPGTLPAELKEITDQFRAGQADFLAVLATQNNLLQERRIHLDVLNQLAQSAAAVIQATGLSPKQVICLPDDEPGPEIVP